MPKKYEDNLIGTNLDKCRLIGKLGTGGMGSVYLAEHFGLNRQVALKILPADMSRDPEYVARFMREATAAGRMEHRNIVPVYDVGYAKNRHFIVMQYIDGESLSTVVDNLGPMEPRDAAAVGVGILRGLHHAHERHIVHRDVKPDNVLIAQGNESKLLDFGLAIETESSLKITKDGLVVGTPYYLSPEQARGQKATPQCDVYAAGVTLYYVLTGRRPFVGATALAVLNKHIHDTAIPPSTVNPKIPKPLSDIILKMMAKRPEDRYLTAEAAADDLAKFLKGTPLKSILSWRLRFANVPRKTRMIAAGSAGAGALVLLTILLAAAFSGGPPPPPDPDGQPPGPVAPVQPPGERFRIALKEILDYQKAHERDFAAYPEIIGRYENFVKTAPDQELKDLADRHQVDFSRAMEKRAQELYGALRKDPDPWLRIQALDGFPPPLLDLTSAGRRVKEERARVAERLEQRYTTHRRKLNRAILEGDFTEARNLLGDMLRYAEGSRRGELIAIQRDLPRLEAEFKDPLVQAYVKVHAEFEAALVKRDFPGAYTRVTDFVKRAKSRSEKARLRAAGVNYGLLLGSLPNEGLSVSKLGQLRVALASAWANPDGSVAYRVLSDLQDALDISWIIQRAGRALNDLSRESSRGRGKALRFTTFKGEGKVLQDRRGFVFDRRGGGQTPIVIRELHPADFVMLAAQAEGLTVQEAYDSSSAVARAAGAAYLYSEAPERWPLASRWFRRSFQLNAAGPSVRLAEIRDRASDEFHQRLLKAREDITARRFEDARATLKGLEGEWGHDREWSEQVGKATAGLLSAELDIAGTRRDHNRVKALARELRESYDGLFDTQTVNRLYGHALRRTGRWEPVSTKLDGTNWRWPGKADGAPAPAKDEGYEGLRLAPGRSIQISPVRARRSAGLSFYLRVDTPKRPYSAGVEFDRSEDGTYRRLVYEDPGQLALYTGDADGEILLDSMMLEKTAPGDWISLALIFEGGDLFCYLNQSPVITLRAEVGTDSPLVLFSTVEANFRSLTLRK